MWRFWVSAGVLCSRSYGCDCGHLKEPGDLHVYAEQFDFIYCFDVMVHMDVHTMYRYFQCLRGMLKAAGKAFVSTANILSPGIVLQEDFAAEKIHCRL